MSDTKIFASIVDDVTKQQVRALEESDAYRDCVIRVMPDCHAGKGCTIGTVIKFRDRVVPNTVGVDVSCGMLVAELGPVDIDLAELDKIVTESIPCGFNVHPNPVADFYFDNFIAPLQKIDYYRQSIGTLGGGNHFIELDVDDEGSKYLVIHSGSRNLGVQICDYWQKVGISKLTDDGAARRELIDRLTAEGRQKEIGDALKAMVKPKIVEDLAYIEGDDLKGYLNDMALCQDYAEHNRYTMVNIILEKLDLEPIDCFQSIHNYIDIYQSIIRKGAISAAAGQRVIIPMNMRDGSLICVGRGNEDWLCSAPHGAGRIMSRKQAVEKLDMADFKRSMEGIFTTSVCEGTIDEAPMVYKPKEQIMEDIKDTVFIEKVIKPLWNFKAKTKE